MFVMYVAYDIKGGVEYAKVCISKRNGDKTSKNYINLGRVLDKKRCIYKNRERGVFTYSVENNTYGIPDSTVVLPDIPARRREKLLLDFGDTFFLYSYLQKSGLEAIIDAIEYGNPDTLYSMIFYYMLCSAACCHAGDWWEGNYAKVIFPRANLTSQRISDFLVEVGNEHTQRSFFKKYIPYITQCKAKGTNILIDSTGLPNSIHFPLTAISNHNGEIENEVRLIYVTQQETGLPIYFRYCPGNVIDVTTLMHTISELKASGVDTKFAILDAGYYDDDNIMALYESGISFVTRLKENLKLYKRLVAEHLPFIERRENLVSYTGRYAFIKRTECELVEGYKAYAYICLDIERKNNESKKLFSNAKTQKLGNEAVFDKMATQGAFILVSSRRIAEGEILPTYYTRQQIEQIFDIGKNYVGLLPLRVQNESTFRGHLLITFISSIIMKKIQSYMSDTVYNPFSLFMNLRNQKCKVYDNLVIAQEAFKKANDCYKIFDITCPVEIPIT
jgi:hypothetical protein